MLPFRQREIERTLAAVAAQPVRQPPAVFKKQLPRNLVQLPLEMRKIDSAHRRMIDPRPHDMRVSPSFLFMEDNGAGLACETERTFGRIGRTLESRLFDLRALGRVHAQREHELLALGTF